MPNVGFWAVAGAGGAAGGPAMELISTAYGTGSSSAITLSSIPQTYKHLQLRMQMFTDSAFIKMNFNGITTSNYANHTLRGASSSVSSDNDTSQAQIWMRYTAGTSDTYTIPTVILDILDYGSTTKNKTARWLAGLPSTADGLHSIVLGSGFLNDTSAISSLTFTSAAGSFRTNTRISLYGVKG